MEQESVTEVFSVEISAFDMVEIPECEIWLDKCCPGWASEKVFSFEFAEILLLTASGVSFEAFATPVELCALVSFINADSNGLRVMCESGGCMLCERVRCLARFVGPFLEEYRRTLLQI